MMTTTPVQDRLTKAFNLIAFASLHENGDDLFLENLEAEAARIERCVERYYTNTDHNMQYPEFVSDFLQRNYKEIVFGDKFLGDFLDDVTDVDYNQD